MPIHKTAGGGVQWGGNGKVYYGKGASSKAEAQAAAAHANGYKGDEAPKKSKRKPKSALMVGMKK